MTTRNVYVLLGVHSLPYAVHCLHSLCQNSLDPIRLTVIGDNEADCARLQAALATLESIAEIRVRSKAEVDAIAEDVLAPYPNIRHFRTGHPCWRKVTDPFLVDGPHLALQPAERIIIDPDVCFPNRFRFEATPPDGVLLMYQRPNCLYPPRCVERAFGLGIRMADHTDIGIAQVAAAVDWEWLDKLIADLRSQDALPAAMMHIESIVWAAWAMKHGGGYLNPSTWKCWDNQLWKRLVLWLGVGPELLFRFESFEKYRCLHGGGMAKKWFTTLDKKPLVANPMNLEAPTELVPFEEYTREKFTRVWRRKRRMKKMGVKWIRADISGLELK